MTNKDLDLAREWAEFHTHTELVMDGAAARVIQSLPDQIIDAEKVRELLDRWAANPFPTSDEVAVLNDVESLLSPKLPTLADMSMSERDERKWAQADMEQHGRGIITCILDDSVQFMKGNGLLITVWEKDYGKVTPLPDLPRLEWPAQEAPNEETPPAETLHNPSSDHSADLPNPEDVPAGEVWMIRLHENADPVPAFRVHASKYGPGKRWAHYRVGGSMLGFADDEDITLVSRLVQEMAA